MRSKTEFDEASNTMDQRRRHIGPQGLVNDAKRIVGSSLLEEICRFVKIFQRFGFGFSCRVLRN